MTSDGKSDNTNKLEPISPAKRKRLQQAFTHGSKMSGSGNYDYATELFKQCVIGDPGNAIYVQNFLGNLQKKYNNNKKGSKLAGISGAGTKATVKKASMQKDWPGVIKAGLDFLKLNPWDVSTLTAMAHACEELELDDAQLTYLKAALDYNIKDAAVNRAAAKVLARVGRFDEAITCWTRVQQADPSDMEAQRAIGNLTVEKTISRGGYEGAETSRDVRNRGGAGGDDEADQPGMRMTPERQLEKAIAKDPSDTANYLKLAELHQRRERWDEAEKVMRQALEASGGDMNIRERLEDLELRRLRDQVAVAEKQAQTEKTAEAVELYKKLREELNRKELEIYQARSNRYPTHLGLKFELAVRLVRAGMVKEAIKQFQDAKGDPRHKGEAMLYLGECFQRIKQYKLAMNSYRDAVEAIAAVDVDLKKKALYRAGCLAMALKDWDSSEKYLTTLAELDFGYKDVAERLDKIPELRDKG